MHSDRLLAHLGAATDRVRVAAETTDPVAPVPTCPGWDVTALIVHLGGVHLWAEEAARTGARPTRPQDGRTLQQWYADASQRLLKTLGEVDPAAPGLDVRDRPDGGVLAPPTGPRDAGPSG